MELRRLKARLKTAVRGHKLLKDKTDEMIRRFLLLISENKRLRQEVEAELGAAQAGFMLARAVSRDFVIEEALFIPAYEAEITLGSEDLMGLKVPKFTLAEKTSAEMFPYSFTSVTAELDSAIVALDSVLFRLLRLAEVEKAASLLAFEIEKNRRRVNALEYVMIPQLIETIKYIAMKLDENERASLVRLMKVKAMLEGRGADTPPETLG
jgi:V/A-type H+-transporting ATPase subunit D